MKTLSILSLFLLFVVPGVNAQAIDVAVVETAGGGEGGGAATVAQLNDDTFFDFTATLVDPSGVDSAAELASYDVVVLGGAGHGNDPIWSVAMANALKEFVEAGGGVLMTGWGQFNSQTGGAANAEPAAILDTVVPGDLVNAYSFSFACCQLDTSIELTDLNHPITQGLPAFVAYGDGCCLEYNRHPLQPGDVSLGIPSPANNGPGHSLIYRENIGAGTGRSVYLGAPHLGSVSAWPRVQFGLRFGAGDQLLEQALAWLGPPVDADADGDGVLDGDDFCPDTAPNDPVDAVGCSDVQVDADGDGVCDLEAASGGPSECIGVDVCVDTSIPESVPLTAKLNPNHWALTDDNFDFDTVAKGRGKGPGRSYTTADTAGCSCDQIIEAQGLGTGHTYHGCSIGVMDDWVELVTP